VRASGSVAKHRHGQRLVTDRPKRCGREYTISGDSIVPRSNGPTTCRSATESHKKISLKLTRDLQVPHWRPWVHRFSKFSLPSITPQF
jgi:hypothetical protein